MTVLISQVSSNGTGTFDDDDDEEHFTDVHGPDSDAEGGATSDEEDDEKKQKSAVGWVHREMVDGKVMFCYLIPNAPCLDG